MNEPVFNNADKILTYLLITHCYSLELIIFLCAEIHCTNLFTQDSSFLNNVWPSDQGLAWFRFRNVNVTSKVNSIPRVCIVLKFLLRLSTLFYLILLICLVYVFLLILFSSLFSSKSSLSSSAIPYLYFSLRHPFFIISRRKFCWRLECYF